MKKGFRILVLSLTTLTILSLATVTFASDDIGTGAEYMVDESNIVYVLQDGNYVAVKYQPMSPNIENNSKMARNAGFGESSASWMYSKTDNGYTVNHKGWKEANPSSTYGVRACSKTGCTPSKNHWTQARMTNGLGISITDSGQVWGTGTPSARSPYANVLPINSIMRSTWGGVGTVISQW